METTRTVDSSRSAGVVSRGGRGTSGRLRRLAGLLATAATLAAAAGWVVMLRPQALGGPVAYLMVVGNSMEPTLTDGDLVVVRGQEAYGLGDVVAYRVPEGEVGAGGVVIHRIVGSTRERHVLKGDNRRVTDPWRPMPGEVVGKLWLTLPDGAHWLALLRSPRFTAAIGGCVAFMIVATGGQGPRIGRRHPIEPETRTAQRAGRANSPGG